MNERLFVDVCKDIIIDYNNKNKEVKITRDNIFVVWLCKTLQNNKALLSTTVEDGMYYELTYNGNKNEIYIDAYKKEYNESIRLLNDNIK